MLHVPLNQDSPASLNLAWLNQIAVVMVQGDLVAPRGMQTKEILQKTLEFDMNYPVLTLPARKLGYKFMAAEAWWILSGRNDVESIAPYSKAISQFSDDGETFFGSYGVPFVEQLAYVVDTLFKDRDTRQATMTFWRQNPPQTRDVPCTVAIDFKIRHGKLHTQVFMRSSDNWLGIPYDAFNFTMMTCRVLEMLNPCLEDNIHLGTMRLTAASSHIYDRNWEAIQQIIDGNHEVPEMRPVPENLYGVYDRHQRAYGLIEHLRYLKDCNGQSKFRWWDPRPIAPGLEG